MTDIPHSADHAAPAARSPAAYGGTHARAPRGAPHHARKQAQDPLERASEFIREHEQLASRRGLWEGHWREVAERVRPNQDFNMRRAPGQKHGQRIFDDTAPLALSKFAAAVISMSFPATQRYHSLTTHDPQLSKDVEVRRYLEQVTDILFRVRYQPQANFQAQSGECVMDVGAFGTGVLFIDDVVGRGIRYKSLPLAETYVAEDGHGVIDTLHRRFELSAHQAASLFGVDALPERIRVALEHDKNERFDFLHCVKPNRDCHGERLDGHNMPYCSVYIALDDRAIVSEGGYRVFPFCAPRFETAPGETYGRSPAMKVLPTIKTLNEMKKTLLRAGQKVVDPPVMLTDDGSLQSFNMRPNALNFGYVDSNGRPLAIPFESRGQVQLGMELLNAEREVINDAFFVTLFRILVQEPAITATEAMLRAQEKGQLLAPTMGRIQTELLGPLITRELDILAHSGMLPPMPPLLKEAGGLVQVEYQSPLNLAQRAAAGVGIMNTLQAVAPLAQFDPRVPMLFDAVAMARELASINGVPEHTMHSDEEIAQQQKVKQQAEQLQSLLQAAPIAASAAKNFAQAGAVASSMSGPPPAAAAGEGV